jgi:hypothetical protein
LRLPPEPPPEPNRDNTATTGNSSLKYPLVIVGAATSIIGMLALFVVVNPLVGIAIFWILMSAFGYGLYRLLTADDQP